MDADCGGGQAAARADDGETFVTRFRVRALHCRARRMGNAPNSDLPGRPPRDVPAFPADLALARDVVAGRTERLPELAARFACLPQIVRGLVAIHGARLEEHEALDVAQDAILCAWEKLAEYSGDSQLEGWLYGIARFEVLNARRRRARRKPFVGEVESVADRARPEDGRAAEYESLHAELQRLEDGAAQIVRLKHFEDLTFDEIGERLGISPNTAKTRYYRGMTLLQQRLRAALAKDRHP